MHAQAYFFIKISKSVELFMLSDHSENFVESWKFLDRQIKDILSYGKGINDVNKKKSLLIL